MEDDTGYFFGLRDEASRINLNTASTDMLLKLPRSTSELAASIVDWRDRDDDVTTGGAESGYYLLLADPYYCKNGPFETVEELLLVKGADTTLLYGEDTNRNGLLDANENDATDTDPPDNRDGRLDRGVLDYLTVYSREENLSSTGEARINVNDANSASALRTLLNNVMAQEKSLQVMSRVRGGRPFRNVLDFYFRTGLTLDEFTQIADQLATGTDRVLTGLLDVNTAPRPVLLCLPGLEASDVDALISKRQASDADLTSIAWVAGALPQEKAVAIGSLITARSYQFSADIVAASGNGRAFRRYKAIIDASAGPPKVVFWKDVTHLGWPLDPTILATLRAGKLVAPSVGIATGGGS
jgi:type II secretory pathway component PulK